MTKSTYILVVYIPKPEEETDKRLYFNRQPSQFNSQCM